MTHRNKILHYFLYLHYYKKLQQEITFETIFKNLNGIKYKIRKMRYIDEINESFY